ncbi:galactocerebrosidase-like isoform X1 [Dreissena polymorpha]|uniref:galactosylceramidase n=1 Tax=Dreissena polymorpha TaxID=45954 RepID=A0A9D4BQX8_DREPO|nr:galactocerebrosidase-like isoform X1 [Dreissena polymorpha]KAH3705349.1 hypothetical protein DPMN_080418 [Dreissena polymorpha]
MSSVIANLFVCIVGFVNVLNASTVYKVVPTRNEAGRYNGIGGLSGGGKDVYVVKTDNLERRFLGIGGLSAGATSKLLMNYPEEQRNQILDYLFKPGFGASLQMLKVEIGGDAQSTDGTEASHMHYPWDENYQRGYEWWLMVEAKKRNSDILLYCLPWAFPAWVGAGKRDPYNDPELTASYVVKFIQGARKYYNLTMAYVGIWNERPYSSKYIKTLRQMLDEAGLDRAPKIVASDDLGWEPIASDILADEELAKAVDIIGVHYPGTTTTQKAIDTGKPLWSSEDYSTFNDNVGAGCWARILNQNYVNGYMTSTISWNLIASYYEDLPYARDGLMTADSPWSGYYRVDAPIWVTAHTTQFAWPGWYYAPQGSGSSLLKDGGSMVSLVSWDSTQLTIVIETMSRNHSMCIRPYLPEYEVRPQNISIQLQGYFAQLTSMFVHYSKLGFDGEDSILFKDMGTIPVVNGTIHLSLGVDEMYTLNTIGGGRKGNSSNIPPQKPFPLPYMDDFESYQEFMEPFNLAQQVGAFEIIKTTSSHGNVIRQMVLEAPIFWCEEETSPFNIIGNTSWSDIYVELDVYIGTVNATSGAYIAARVNKGGCESFSAEGVFFFIFPGQGIVVTGDLARTKELYKQDMNISTNTWYKMELLVKDGQVICLLNSKLVVRIAAPFSPAPQNGFVALGTADFGLADFDNLKIADSTEGSLVVKGRFTADEVSYDEKFKDVKDKLKDTLYFKSQRFNTVK